MPDFGNKIIAKEAEVIMDEALKLIENITDEEYSLLMKAIVRSLARVYDQGYDAKGEGY